MTGNRKIIDVILSKANRLAQFLCKTFLNLSNAKLDFNRSMFSCRTSLPPDAIANGLDDVFVLRLSGGQRLEIVYSAEDFSRPRQVGVILVHPALQPKIRDRERERYG